MIDVAVMSCNDDPIYWEFWNPVSAHWHNEFGIRSLLFYYGAPNPSLSTEHGDVIYQEPVEGIPDYVAATWGRFWVTKHMRNKMCLISDIDMFPLSRDFFLYKSEPRNDAYTHLNADAYCPGDFSYWKHDGTSVPICYHLATSSMLEKVYGFSDSYVEEINKILTADYRQYPNGFSNTTESHLQRASAVNGGKWGIDEMYSSVCVRNYYRSGGKVITKESIGPNKRLCRSRMQSQFQTLSLGSHVDFHSIRPYQQNKDTILNILKLGTL